MPQLQVSSKCGIYWTQQAIARNSFFKIQCNRSKRRKQIVPTVFIDVYVHQLEVCVVLIMKILRKKEQKDTTVPRMLSIRVSQRRSVHTQCELNLVSRKLQFFVFQQTFLLLLQSTFSYKSIILMLKISPKTYTYPFALLEYLLSSYDDVLFQAGIILVC